MNRRLEHKNIEYDKMLLEINKKIESISDKSSLADIERGASKFAKELNKKMNDLDLLEKKLIELFERVSSKDQIIQTVPEERMDSGIIIRKDKALSQLTETEFKVLNILAEEKSLTAPQIRKSIGLSREHTARLMKRLYERGYLDRNTFGIPYSYHVKNEMLKIMKKNNDE